MLDNLLGDHPTTEQQIAVVVSSLSSYIKTSNEFRREVNLKHEEIVKSIAALAELQRIQNGNVASLKKELNKHDDWHGENDENIADRIGSLEKDKELRDFAIKIGLVAFGFGVGAVTFVEKLGLFNSLF